MVSGRVLANGKPAFRENGVQTRGGGSSRAGQRLRRPSGPARGSPATITDARLAAVTQAERRGRAFKRPTIICLCRASVSDATGLIDRFDERRQILSRLYFPYPANLPSGLD